MPKVVWSDGASGVGKWRLEDAGSGGRRAIGKSDMEKEQLDDYHYTGLQQKGEVIACAEPVEHSAP